MQPITTAEDRSIAVPPGQKIRTGYVHIDQVKLACRARMAPADVKEKYERRLQLGDHQPWPPPRGHWEGEPEKPGSRFVVIDGRHDTVSALMLGQEWLFVAWADGGL